jgi:copper chaperone CopZ
MKKLFFCLLAGTVFTISASAQSQKPIQTVKLSTPTVQCGSCKSKFETYLKRYNGITSVNVNYKKKETTVKYYTERINEEEIKTAIANAGYDANDVTANPASYKLLPQCCKKPEDGGDGVK